MEKHTMPEAVEVGSYQQYRLPLSPEGIRNGPIDFEIELDGSWRQTYISGRLIEYRVVESAILQLIGWEPPADIPMALHNLRPIAKANTIDWQIVKFDDGRAGIASPRTWMPGLFDHQDAADSWLDPIGMNLTVCEGSVRGVVRVHTISDDQLAAVLPRIEWLEQVVYRVNEDYEAAGVALWATVRSLWEIACLKGTSLVRPIDPDT